MGLMMIWKVTIISMDYGWKWWLDDPSGVSFGQITIATKNTQFNLSLFINHTSDHWILFFLLLVSFLITQTIILIVALLITVVGWRVVLISWVIIKAFFPSLECYHCWPLLSPFIDHKKSMSTQLDGQCINTVCQLN